MHHLTFKKLFTASVAQYKAVDLNAVANELAVKHGYTITQARFLVLDCAWLAIMNFRGEVEEDILNSATESDCVMKYIESAEGMEVSFSDFNAEYALKMFNQVITYPEFAATIAVESKECVDGSIRWTVKESDTKLSLTVRKAGYSNYYLKYNGENKDFWCLGEALAYARDILLAIRNKEIHDQKAGE